MACHFERGKFGLGANRDSVISFISFSSEDLSSTGTWSEPPRDPVQLQGHTVTVERDELRAQFCNLVTKGRD